jgi:hypothetical protein
LARLRTLGTVFGTADPAFIDSQTVQGSPDDVITNTGQILDPAPADEDDGVFLKIVSFTADVGDHFITVSQTHFTNLPKRPLRTS